MHKLIRIGLRVLVVLAVAAVVVPLLSPPGGGASPYGSSLSNFEMVSTAEAACNGSVCARGGATCNPATRARCSFTTGTCRNVKC